MILQGIVLITNGSYQDFFLNNSMVILLFGLRNMGVTSWYQSHGLREIKYVEVNT
ncbi:hypothetical protein HanRHA438_Chr02g0050611 [Helianthus annuus]|nr:hypothetical protein HanHA300_Chr02g0040191 [Helianthus annuus]KAJ0617571.1 hypothetical protein HanHA89_Chr02g0043301 [Helianthus annuus]KAJ0776106.1 hypothetical protein HanLR1_Chr02g0041821 [Helianthus annuus]KAJ0938509.1 hypothetical protein HanRHA438_Chr02g0050611 [Helianthus annuus]